MGPTAVGKTRLCVALAKHLNCGVISADSRQFYQEMEIGTAKPTTDEMQGVAHHFINSHSIESPITAADFESKFLELIQTLHHDYVILTGGSGLFVKAALEGLQPLPNDDAVQQELREKESKLGLDILVKELQEVDPASFNRIDLKNSQRVLRALEVYYASGKTMTWWLENSKVLPRPFQKEVFVLERDREILYQRINQRVDDMIDKGLEQEVKSLIAYKNEPPLQTVGYHEWWPYFNGDYDQDEVIRLIKRNTRRYAKRQLTWFKGQLTQPYALIQAHKTVEEQVQDILTKI